MDQDIVRYPFRPNFPVALKDLYNNSLSYLRSVKWRFSSNPKFNDLYKGHMVPVTVLMVSLRIKVTLKNKVAFDASTLTTSRLSLIDLLL